MGLLTKMFMPVGLGGMGVGKNPFASKGSSGPSPMDLFSQIIDKYSYKPAYTGQFEKGLYDLFQQTTGLGGGGVNAIPFDIGLPTTGLYDSLTRGIKEDYLGTPGGPEGGRIADTRAYYNNLGIPEQAINQERLANRDLNNTLTDTAAQINETQKDRLLNVLNMGSNLGLGAYGQNLAQHSRNAGIAAQGAGLDIGLQDSINRANQDSLNALLSAGAYLAGSSMGGPVGGAAASQGLNFFINSQNPNAPLTVNKGVDLLGGNYNQPFNFKNSGYKANLIN